MNFPSDSKTGSVSPLVLYQFGFIWCLSAVWFNSISLPICTLFFSESDWATLRYLQNYNKNNIFTFSSFFFYIISVSPRWFFCYYFCNRAQLGYLQNKHREIDVPFGCVGLPAWINSEWMYISCGLHRILSHHSCVQWSENGSNWARL